MLNPLWLLFTIVVWIKKEDGKDFILGFYDKLAKNIKCQVLKKFQVSLLSLI